MMNAGIRMWIIGCCDLWMLNFDAVVYRVVATDAWTCRGLAPCVCPLPLPLFPRFFRSTAKHSVPQVFLMLYRAGHKPFRGMISLHTAHCLSLTGLERSTAEHPCPQVVRLLNWTFRSSPRCVSSLPQARQCICLVGGGSLGSVDGCDGNGVKPRRFLKPCRYSYSSRLSKIMLSATYRLGAVPTRLKLHRR